MLMSQGIRASRFSNRAAISYVNFSTTSTRHRNLTIAKPAGVTEGDLMIGIMGVNRYNTNYTWSKGADWTEMLAQGPAPDLYAVYKYATASEGSGYQFSVNEFYATYLAGCILVYRGAIFDKVGSFAANVAPISIPGVFVADDRSIIIATGITAANDNTQLSVPTGMTSRVNIAGSSTSPAIRVCDQVVDSGNSGNRIMTISQTVLARTGVMISLNRR